MCATRAADTLAGGPLAWYTARRTAILATAASGAAAARELAELTDEAVVALAGTVPPHERRPFAIFALGGYGANRLLPGSDIDLLIVSEGDASEHRPLVQTLLYPLWDTGVDVGHQVRTRTGQVRAVSTELTAATAFLTARFIAGDERLAHRVVADVFKRLHRDRRRLLDQISARTRTGSPYLLAPDLKEGPAVSGTSTNSCGARRSRPDDRSRVFREGRHSKRPRIR